MLIKSILLLHGYNLNWGPYIKINTSARFEKWRAVLYRQLQKGLATESLSHGSMNARLASAKGKDDYSCSCTCEQSLHSCKFCINIYNTLVVSPVLSLVMVSLKWKKYPP